MRHELGIDDRRLCWLDFGGPGRPLLALHGGMSEAAAWTGLAEVLGDQWRVIAPDQRGHGESDRAAEHGREGYVSDAVALLDHLGLDSVAVVGFSLGAMNAYHLAARQPHRVSALVNTEGPVEIAPGGTDRFAFLTGLPYTADTREELLAALGAMAPAYEPALRPLPGGGWRLPFHPQDVLDTIAAAAPDNWDAWLATTCPALLVHGRRSQALPQAQADAMVARRPNTAYTGLDTEHFLPFQDPQGFHQAVRTFLAGL
ncbi:alpha/beta fold hydrolase [Streptomyces sp. NPDC127106]|uniref:alpha/beta fold hydrolase n=1 Tax=Streptomyces sp. NPDC127106 TaxID=3345360 RepID=UPI0036405232